MLTLRLSLTRSAHCQWYYGGGACYDTVTSESGCHGGPGALAIILLVVTVRLTGTVVLRLRMPP